MFDEIEDELFCPFCGTKNDEFQSKDTGDGLTSWTIEEIEKYWERKDIIEIHEICKNCKKFISINLRGRASKDELNKLVSEKLKGMKKSNGK